MTTLREAAQQALEALEAALSDDQPYIERCKQTITALKTALAEPEPFQPDWDRIEPLQESLREYMAEIHRLRAKLAEPVQEPVLNPAPGYCKHCKQYTIEEPLPAEPVQEPDYWQEEARRYAGNADYWRKRYEALAEPVQEPVAWMVYTLDGKSVCVTDNPNDFTPEHRALPLYTKGNT